MAQRLAYTADRTLPAWSPPSAFLAAALASLLGAWAIHALIPADEERAGL
jgi:hypothetical protein